MSSNPTSFPGRIFRFLGSLKFSFVLLVFLLLLAAQRAIIDQNAVLAGEENLPWFLQLLQEAGLDTVANLEPIFYLALVLFMINLVLSSFTMTRTNLKKQLVLKGTRKKEAILALANHAELFSRNDSFAHIKSFFKQQSLTVRTVKKEDGQTSLYAGKRESGSWGVLLFHMTFIIVLVGALLTLLTRQTGYVELSPGDIFVEKLENYEEASEPPIFFGGDRRFQMQLDKVDISFYRPGEIRQRASLVSVTDRNGFSLGTHRIEINNPLTVDGIQIYITRYHGFMARLSVFDQVGTKVNGDVRFRYPKSDVDVVKSWTHLPGTVLDLELELYTDKYNGINGLESLALRHEATLLKVTSIDDLGRRIFRGVVFEHGPPLSFEGLTIRFDKLEPFVTFYLTRDYGVPVIFSGFVFLLFGLLVTYFWVSVRYWVVISPRKEGGQQVIIGATRGRYKDSFKELFNDQMAVLQKEMDN